MFMINTCSFMKKKKNALQLFVNMCVCLCVCVCGGGGGQRSGLFQMYLSSWAVSAETIQKNLELMGRQIKNLERDLETFPPPQNEKDQFVEKMSISFSIPIFIRICELESDAFLIFSFLCTVISSVFLNPVSSQLCSQCS